MENIHPEEGKLLGVSTIAAGNFSPKEGVSNKKESNYGLAYQFKLEAGADKTLSPSGVAQQIFFVDLLSDGWSYRQPTVQWFRDPAPCLLWPHHAGGLNPSHPPGWGRNEEGTLTSEPTAGKHTHYFSCVCWQWWVVKNLPTHMGSRRRDRLLWKMGLNHWKATATSVTVNWVVLLADTNLLFSMAIFILASQFLLHLALIVWHSYAKQNNIYRGWKQATLGGMQACPLLCVTSLFSMCTRRNASQVTWRRKPDCSHFCPIVIKRNTWRMAGFR